MVWSVRMDHQVQFDDYFALFLDVTSNITAAARTRALMMYCQDMSMPIKFMPFVNEIMTNAPMSDPITLPTPPVADTPPTNAAAMASNSNRLPAVVVADRKRDAYSISDKPASMPIEAKTT